MNICAENPPLCKAEKRYGQGKMTTLKLNSVKQTLGFFSMTIAWALMNLLHSVYLGWTDGKADDSGVVIFWSGLFIAIAWAVFIIYPLKKLDHTKNIFKPTIFPIISAIYGALTYSIIVGGLFRSFELVTMFMPLALLTGAIFGVSYSLLIQSDRVVDLPNRRPFTKIFFILSPALILFFFLSVMPAIGPSLVFRFMPDEIRYKIVAKTIPKYKVGDDFEPLKNDLPGYLDHIDNGSGNMSASMENFAFVLQVNCGKIIRLEYGKNSTDFDNTIYGKLQEKPCP
ncbi:hypothetical protein WBJ53_21280 [Spirosoma sp. SC4-14]|uniref:hypothetical protein n=1 Tax=Spirosoma sp. SC4-14 TaxID=3128900 RepID=UPI0030D347B7